MKTTLALSLFLIAFPAAHAQTEPPLPLPDAPVQLVIPDPAAADRALTGGFRKALTGTLEETDPVGAALHRTRVGGKLASQWELFTADLSLSWKDLIATRPTSIGFAILAAGDLEAVLALRTPLAALPIPLPPGKAFDHRGVACHLVSRGAGDERTQDRRIGLAWTKTGGTLLLATSERALKLAVDKAVSNAGVQPFLPGLASLRLDLDALRKDLYFRREFLFAEGSTGPETGVLLAALRDEAPGLVEVREGAAAAPATPAARWATAGRGLAAAGWETDGARLFTALRRGLLETVPSPESRPVQPLKPLPEPNATSPDRYLVDLTKPVALSELGGTGELPQWAEALQPHVASGFGWEIGGGGARRIVVAAPATFDTRFASLAKATIERRAGFSAESKGEANATELSVGPGLPALAWKRSGGFLWIATSAADLAGVPEPKAEAGLARWSQLDLEAVRKAGTGWKAAEGAFSPDETRPFSDRVLGILGWMPKTSALTTERRFTAGAFSERVAFTHAAAAASAAAPAAPKPAAAPKKPPK